MIISGKQIQNILKAYGDSKIEKGTKTEKTSPAYKKDEVILSSQAQEFGQILQNIKNSSDVREDKVKELTERINSGNYNIDAKDVAEKMIGRLMADKLR
ncbi:flagellar biosynthesis anti-sigma factor FlgM [Dendrosporobacter sp. 1207_IL3150]|uniref:flagellar biosynthesis anti-sigma factor FlgM n=1 Tax=Dendrosporobacter sp. 1207_IL3150 TaxID=3084054 RepID=UPI002FDA2119